MFRRFLYLNGLAALAVVLFHAGGMGFVAMFAWADQYLPAGVSAFSQVGNFQYYVLRLIEQVIVFAIPAFLIVSGSSIVTAVGKNQSTVSWRIVISRIKFLLIPYLVWSTVVILLGIIEGRSYSLTLDH